MCWTSVRRLSRSGIDIAFLLGHANARVHRQLQAKVNPMNADQIKGNWKQVKGEVKNRWGELTDDDLTEVEGDRDKLVGKVQERYGITKEEAERQVDEMN